MFDFLRILVQFFEKHEIPYMLSGSVAMSSYTLPRFTRDLDFIVYLKPADAALFANHFKEGYYCDEDSIRDAITQKGMFNIIDHKSFYKADFVILKEDPYRKIEFERRKQVDIFDMKVWLVAPEDLLLSKLIWIQEIQSAQQAEDIKLLSANKDIDWSYIRNWVEKLKLNTFDLFQR